MAGACCRRCANDACTWPSWWTSTVEPKVSGCDLRHLNAPVYWSLSGTSGSHLLFVFFIVVGLVSLEDIVEEVVGEIFDEDDEDNYEFAEDSITMQDDGSFLMRGDADLSDVDTILNLNLSEDDSLKEFATLSGFLCMCAGEIPSIGDFIMSKGWCFEIVNADDKRILQARVERLLGSFDEDDDGPESENPFKNLLSLKQGGKQMDSVESDVGSESADCDFAALEKAAENELHGLVAENSEGAKAVERMVESGERKRELLEAVRNEAMDNED